MVHELDVGFKSLNLDLHLSERCVELVLLQIVLLQLLKEVVQVLLDGSCEMFYVD